MKQIKFKLCNADQQSINNPVEFLDIMPKKMFRHLATLKLLFQIKIYDRQRFRQEVLLLLTYVFIVLLTCHQRPLFPTSRF